MDAAQGVAEDVTQDVAEDVLGAAEDGSVEVLIAARAIFQRRNPRPTHARRPPRCLWAAREGEACEERGAGHGERGGGRATGRGAGLGLRGPGGARPPRHATTHHRRRRRLCAARAEMGAQLGSSVAFGSGCGKAYVHSQVAARSGGGTKIP